MAVAAESNNSLRIEECNFSKLVLNKIFFGPFQLYNYPLTAKYTAEKLTAT